RTSLGLSGQNEATEGWRDCRLPIADCVRRWHFQSRIGNRKSASSPCLEMSPNVSLGRSVSTRRIGKRSAGQRLGEAVSRPWHGSGTFAIAEQWGVGSVAWGVLLEFELLSLELLWDLFFEIWSFATSELRHHQSPSPSP